MYQQHMLCQTFDASRLMRFVKCKFKELILFAFMLPYIFSSGFCAFFFELLSNGEVKFVEQCWIQQQLEHHNSHRNQSCCLLIFICFVLSCIKMTTFQQLQL